MLKQSGQLLFKRCSKCSELKPVDGFYIKRGRYTSQCRQCLVRATAAWTQKNPEKRMANWRNSRDRNRDRYNEQNRNWYQRNPETKRRYVNNNRERIRRIAREYARRNLDKYNANWHKRRARKLGNGGSHTVADIRLLFQSQNGKCANLACLQILEKYHVDHVIPIALGGTDNPLNLQLLCPPCNRRKNAKAPHVWAKENGLLFA